MKTAVLSDIHSNLEALTRCCEHAASQGVERYVCLGDCVGYGADPEKTLRLLMSLPGLIAVRGNHDEALLRDASDTVAGPVKAAAEWTRGRLTPGQWRFLADLPYLHADGSATYVHASAYAPTRWEYLRMPEQVEACIQASATPLTFIGHVHVPKVFYETPNGALREFDPLNGVPIPLSPTQRYVINVGSVGQPRDGNNAACYVVYDDSAGDVMFHRLAYDYVGAGRKILAAHLDPYFADRLAYGR